MSNLIPREFINELLERCDIVEVIQTHLSLRKRGANFLACCPFHNEKTPSFTVSPSKQFYHCFGCGVSGNAITFLMEYDRLSFVEAIETLAKQQGIEVPRKESGSQGIETQDAKEKLYQILQKANYFYQEQLQKRENQKALDYLSQRGIDKKIIEQYELGFAPPGWNNLQQVSENTKESMNSLIRSGLIIKNTNGNYYDRFRDRILFPIHNRQGRVIGFGGRSLGEEMPKYLNSPETSVFHKGQELYGLHLAQKVLRQESELIIVEGYMDVLTLAQYGISNVVASSGTAVTQEQFKRCFRHVSRLLFCFDGDDAGFKAAWRALENVFPLIQDGRQVRFVFLPEGEDPDSMLRKEGIERFNERFHKATLLSDYFFQTICSKADLSSLDGKASLKQKALPLLKKLSDGVFKELMQDRLAKVLRIDPEKLEKMMGESKEVSPSTRSKAPLKNVQPASPVRFAIALLVQNPGLFQAIENIAPITSLHQPGIELLAELLELFNQCPNINTGGIVEYFRGRPEANIINKLAAWELHIPETGMEDEFNGVIRRLSQLSKEQMIEQLLAKAASEGLSDEDRLTLQRLISEQHKK